MRNCRVFGFCFVVSFILFSVNSIFALPCDINESNRVDGFDLILFSRVRGSTPTSPRWFPEADVNNDKIIDEKDLEILTKHFARRGIVSSLWVVDYNSNKIIKLSGITGKELLRLGCFLNPYALGINPFDGSCWIADQNNNQIVKLISTATTELLRIGGFNQPCFVSVNSVDESLWIADCYNNQLVRLDKNGAELVRAGGFNRPVSAAVDIFDGGCWVADYEKNQVVKLSPGGKELKRLSGFNRPRCVALIPEEIKPDAPQINVLEDSDCIDIGGDVNFNIVCSDVNGVIEKFELDFDGDGIFDSSLDSNSSGSIIHVYESAGVYNPVVKARDDSWLVNYDYKNIIRVGKLTVKASANPISGKAPLVVNFGSQLFDPVDGRVENYQWDFDGDGIYEFLSVVSGGTSYTYKNLGVHQAVLKVTDTDGSIVFYQWDFDGDSTFDLNSTSGCDVTYIYSIEGIYKPLLRVTDNSGLTDSFYSTVTVKQASAEPEKPHVEAIGSPSFGLAPLAVLFSGTGSDSDGQVVKYEWDFRDKMYFSSDSTGMVNHTYGSTGVYKAVFKVTDNSGLYATTNLLG